MHNNVYTIIFLFLLVWVGPLSPGFAYDTDMDYGTEASYREQNPPITYGEKIGRKFGAGLSNMAFGWLEIPKSIINTANEVNWMFGVTGGLAKGLLNTLGRALTGVADFVTFPIPTKPIPRPYFVWDDFDESTTYGPAFRLYE